MVRLAFLATTFLSGVIAANALLGRSITMTLLALSITIVGLVCARTGDRMSRRTIRILSIVAGAGSVVAAVHVSPWFVLAVVACVVMYLRNGDTPQFDAIERDINGETVADREMRIAASPVAQCVEPGVWEVQGPWPDDRRIHRVVGRTDDGVPVLEPMYPPNVVSIASRADWDRAFGKGSCVASATANDVFEDGPGAA